jgi:hypothetical protein
LVAVWSSGVSEETVSKGKAAAHSYSKQGRCPMICSKIGTQRCVDCQQFLAIIYAGYYITILLYTYTLCCYSIILFVQTLIDAAIHFLFLFRSPNARLYF